jgi:hypothetical protein
MEVHFCHIKDLQSKNVLCLKNTQRLLTDEQVLYNWIRSAEIAQQQIEREQCPLDRAIALGDYIIEIGFRPPTYKIYWWCDGDVYSTA